MKRIAFVLKIVSEERDGAISGIRSLREAFEQAKKEKEAKKKQKVISVKEIQLSIRIETNDFNTKANHAIKFLTGGDKVKVVLRFRGREITRPELGKEIMDKFLEACSEVGTSAKPPKIEGRSLVMILEPKPVTK